jgi:hypothetical protein
MNSIVEIPSWLVEQFEIESEGPGLLEDKVERFEVHGDFEDSEGDPLLVELECCSGQSNWWATINVFLKRTGELVAQSEPFHDILGTQEFSYYNDEAEFFLTFETVEGIPPENLNRTEALKLLKGLALTPMDEEIPRGAEIDHDPIEVLDAFVAAARRLVYPHRPKITRS